MGKQVDLLDAGPLSRLERFNIELVRKSVEQPQIDGAVRWLQRNVGAHWIDLSTRNLRQVVGRERVPPFDASKSYILVSNHRTFFDLYVVTSMLVLQGMPQRIFFPVRANFFYDKPLGAVVNGAMSFFAMYPPVFRERKRAPLNLASIDEVVRLLGMGGTFVGMHPEGTRKRDDDPYTFLPAQSGVGRIIRRAKVPVIPVFVNGMSNNMPLQIAHNFVVKTNPVYVVFGEPIDFGGLLDRPDVPRTHKAISDKTLEVIGKLGEEERALRSGVPYAPRANGAQARTTEAQ